MWWDKALSVLTSIVKDPIVEWQKRKTLVVENENKQADRDHEARMKKIDVAFELAKQGQQIEADWDTNAQEQMKHSWKDEWYVLLFSIPLVLVFIPDMQPYIIKGFEALNKTPEWYRWMVMGIVASTFGLRWMFGRLKLK